MGCSDVTEADNNVVVSMALTAMLWGTFISALHGTPALSSNEKGVWPSVSPPVRPSVKRVHCDKTDKRSVQLLHHTKENLG